MVMYGYRAVWDVSRAIWEETSQMYVISLVEMETSGS